MTMQILIIDAIALLLMAIGLNLAFRQRQVLSLWSRLTGRPTAPHSNESPAHYAMIIFGIMLAAFGLIIFSFVTLYGYFTAPPAA